MDVDFFGSQCGGGGDGEIRYLDAFVEFAIVIPLCDIASTIIEFR
jgi:hypothetical protein